MPASVSKKSTKSSDLPVNITQQEYQEAEENMTGLCLTCCAFTYGDTEPDAEEYPCDECGCNSVQGIQNALVEGNVNIVED